MAKDALLKTCIHCYNTNIEFPQYVEKKILNILKLKTAEPRIYVKKSLFNELTERRIRGERMHTTFLSERLSSMILQTHLDLQ